MYYFPSELFVTVDVYLLVHLMLTAWLRWSDQPTQARAAHWRPHKSQWARKPNVIFNVEGYLRRSFFYNNAFGSKV